MTTVSPTDRDALHARWRESAPVIADLDDETPIPRRPAGLTELPLSAAQRRWWHAIRRDPTHPAHNLFLAYRLHGPLGADALVRALHTVVDRHESLRTRFADTASEVTQVIDPPGGFTVTRIDVGDLTEADRPQRVQALVVEQTSTRFDLARGPLVRAWLIRLTDDEHVFGVAMHHLVADGACMGLLLRELNQLYQAASTDAAALPDEAATPNEAAPPQPAIGYGDYALWQWAVPAEAKQEQDRYWHQQLANPPVLELPTDRPRPPRNAASAAVHEHVIAGELAQRLEQLARAQRCTLFVVLLAAYQALLARHSGQQDICVLSALSGRDRVELESMIGNFATFPLLRADLSGDPTFRELIGRTRAVVLAAYAHQELPYQQLMTELSMPRDPSRMALFQTAFILHYEGVPDAEVLPGVRSEYFPGGVPQMFYDVSVDVFRRRDELGTMFRYHDALFSPASVAALARRYEHLLRAVVADPDTPLSSLPLLDDAERERIEQLSTGPMTPLPTTDVLTAVAASAATTPQAVAIECAGESTTYAQLWTAVQAHADRLRADGVGPGSVVNVAPARTADLVVTPLAVWLTGGACCPPDSIAVEQQQLTSQWHAMADLLGSGPDDRWLALAPAADAIMSLELFLPLLVGARVIIADTADHVAAVAELIDTGQVTHLQATPSMWRLLLDAGLHRPELTALVNGEPLALPLARELRARVGRLVYGCGAATTTTWSIAADLPPHIDAVTIGGPIARTWAHVFDEQGEPAPIGVPGELCLGGLIVDPFEEAVGQASPGMTEPGRLHHTGQRARWGPDGQLQLLGRLDDRVVIGGYRVEPAEVESRLAEHPAVAYAAVTVHPDPDGTPNLTAHLVLRQHPDGPTTAGPEPEQLRADLAELLPAYLLPTRIVLVDRLTLRPDGRLDRAALQATP